MLIREGRQVQVGGVLNGSRGWAWISFLLCLLLMTLSAAVILGWRPVDSAPRKATLVVAGLVAASGFGGLVWSLRSLPKVETRERQRDWA